MSPVTNRDGVLAAANRGTPLKVLCTRDATPKNGAWAGIWVVYIIHERNGAPFEELFVHTPQQKPREFRGVYGLLSFAKELGFRAPPLPLYEGESVVWQRDVEEQANKK